MADDWSSDVPNEVFIGSLTGGFLDLGSVVPPELIAFYQAHYGFTPVKAVIRMASTLPTSGDVVYYYFVWGAGHSITDFGFIAFGFVSELLEVRQLWSATNTDEAHNTDQFFTFGAPDQLVQVNIGDGTILGAAALQVQSQSILGISPGALQQVQGALQIFQAGALVLQTGSGYTIDGVDAPRGLAYGIAMSGNPIATSTAGAEVALLTTGSFLYKDTRVYKVTVHGPVSVTAANLGVTVRVRRGSGTGGTELLRWNFAVPSTSSFQELPCIAVIKSPVGGITQQVTYTLQGSAAGNVSMFATAAGQGQIHVEDIGSSTFFPGGFPTW